MWPVRSAVSLTLEALDFANTRIREKDSGRVLAGERELTNSLPPVMTCVFFPSGSFLRARFGTVVKGVNAQYFQA
jgi:hypothetical protein